MGPNYLHHFRVVLGVALVWGFLFLLGPYRSDLRHYPWVSVDAGGSALSTQVNTRQEWQRGLFLSRWSLTGDVSARGTLRVSVEGEARIRDVRYELREAGGEVLLTRVLSEPELAEAIRQEQGSWEIPLPREEFPYDAWRNLWFTVTYERCDAAGCTPRKLALWMESKRDRNCGFYLFDSLMSV